MTCSNTGPMRGRDWANCRYSGTGRYGWYNCWHCDGPWFRRPGRANELAEAIEDQDEPVDPVEEAQLDEEMAALARQPGETAREHWIRTQLPAVEAASELAWVREGRDPWPDEVLAMGPPISTAELLERCRRRL